jgi:RNA polymerase sigma factor (sigma-70 family)
MSETAAERLEWIRSVIDQYQGRLIRFAVRITGDVETARDVVQDTFLRLCRQDLAKTRDHLAPWLFRVCRNRALDIRRKEGPVMPLDEVALAETPGSAPDPHAALESSDASRHLLALLGELPASQQEVLRLRFQEDLSYKEISAVTSHSVSNVGFLIHTGLKQLRQRLSPDATPLVKEGGPSHA